jgi:hypothetical protein
MLVIFTACDVSGAVARLEPQVRSYALETENRNTQASKP